MATTKVTRECEPAQSTKRGPNLTAREKNLIVDLAVKYKHVIENKKTDAMTVQQKEEGWRKLTDEFNASSSVKRSYTQIKQAYSNYKKKAKKDAASDKVEIYKTGGGTFEKKLNPTSEKLLAVLGSRGEPQQNQFDSDAQYNKECDGKPKSKPKQVVCLL